MKSTKDALYKQLFDIVAEAGTDFVLNHLHKASVEAASKQLVYLAATYRVAGVPCTEQIAVDEKVSKFSEYWVTKLLERVTEKIMQQEKTALGMLSVTLLLELRKGTSTKVLGTITASRNWMVEKEDMAKAKTWLTDNYEPMVNTPSAPI